MRILAFSDLHQDSEIAAQMATHATNADVLVGAGDFATRKQGGIAPLAQLREAGKPTIIVPGNHDDVDELIAFCQDWPMGHFLHTRAVTIAGVTFYGLGLEIPKRSNTPWNAAMSEQEAAQALTDCPHQGVLVTHSPPYGHADVQKDGSHEGSHAIADAAKAKQPRLLLCGHIHNAWGMTSKIGSTHIVNLGPTANWFDLP